MKRATAVELLVQAAMDRLTVDGGEPSSQARREARHILSQAKEPRLSQIIKKLTEEGTPPAEDMTALSGREGDRAEVLLARAMDEGSATLSILTGRAIQRLLLNPGKRRDRIFSSTETAQLAESLAATIGTARLLGRSRIQLRMMQGKKFQESPFSVFVDDSIAPFAPEAALKYFAGLIPRLGIDPDSFGAAMRRRAFTMAASTDRVLLHKVQNLIFKKIRTGQEIKSGPREIQQLMDAAGVSPSNPQYAQMVFRTNMMDAYRQGAQQELAAHSDVFPVWQYAGIRDGREGDDHRPMFGRYYPASMPFTKIRGKRVFNCRCDFIPVSKWEWSKLQSRGAELSA